MSRLLVIGGTHFVGRHVVEAALAAGHEVTIFHRGRGDEDPYPEVEHVHGDRDGDLGLLGGRSWDACIDTCGYVPRIVRASAEALREAVDRYVFVSTISVYADGAPAGASEDAALHDPAAVEGVEDVTGETYGPLKVACEQAAEDVLGRALVVVRPGLIVGPYDPTDRFTWWVRRFDDARSGDAVLAPGDPSAPVQVVDGRDLAAFLLHVALDRSDRTSGPFHAVAPDPPLTMAEVLDVCRRAAGADGVELRWVPDEALLAAGVAPWSGIPLWIPADDEGRPDALMAMSAERAVAAGFRWRPIEETVRDTLAWDRGRDRSVPMRAGLAREQERKVLDSLGG